MRNRGAGPVLNVDEWDRFRFRDGQLIESAVFVDVATLDRLVSATSPMK